VGTKRAKFGRSDVEALEGGGVVLKKRTAVVRKERNVRTYAQLWSASRHVLATGLREPKGSTWQFLSSLVLTAFSFEAYLNHVGPTVLSSWDRLERSSTPLSKLDLLCEVLKVQLPGKGSRPLQTITELFKFRNTLAHGRSHTLKAPPLRIDADELENHLGQSLLTEWEELVRDSSFAKRAREDVKAVVMAIHDAQPEPKEYPFTWGFGTHSASIDDA
jgi:hypothetical protein